MEKSKLIEIISLDLRDFVLQDQREELVNQKVKQMANELEIHYHDLLREIINEYCIK